jgi:hypothetical protein
LRFVNGSIVGVVRNETVRFRVKERSGEEKNRKIEQSEQTSGTKVKQKNKNTSIHKKDSDRMSRCKNLIEDLHECVSLLMNDRIY